MIREWVELESKDSAAALALFEKLGLTVEVDRGAYGVTQLILSRDGHSMRLSIGQYSSAIGMFRRKPETKKLWFVRGEVAGLRVNESFEDFESASKRNSDLYCIEGASVQVTEEEVEIPAQTVSR